MYSRRRLVFGRADVQQTSRVHTNRTEMRPERPERREKKNCSIGGNVKHGIGKFEENNLFAKKKFVCRVGQKCVFLNFIR